MDAQETREYEPMGDRNFDGYELMDAYKMTEN